MASKIERKVIDISKWNPVTSWRNIKEDGVEAVMIRVGYGANNSKPTQDVKFKSHIEGAIGVGLPVGVYLYSYARSKQRALIEAEYVIEWLAPYRDKIIYPVAFDVEDKTQRDLGKTIISDMCDEFCRTVKEAGYKPAIYASFDWFKHRISASVASKYHVWLAQWSSRPTYAGHIDIWQYSEKGRVKGISGNVDMNIAYTDFGI